MGISEAIARVRKGAKKAGLEGALASVGASLGAGLQSQAIPPRLRPAASRIASLLGAQAEQPRELPSLERALDAHAAAAHGAGAHAASEVCPFTGLRADGTLAADGAVNVLAGPAAEAQPASARAPDETAAATVEPERPQTAAPELDTAAISSHALPLARGDVREQGSDEPLASNELIESSEPVASNEPVASKPRSTPPRERNSTKRSASGSKPAGSSLRARAATVAPNEKALPAEKGKEKLAGERPVANTSARSANKPAAKQTNGRGNQRKK